MAILIFEHSERTGVQRLGRTLRDLGHRLRIVRLHRDDPFPVDLDDVDGIISCGGPQSANDDSLSWMKQEIELMRLAVQREMPVVGLCLGSQILARAMGGEVKQMDSPEVGWREVRLTPAGREDPLHAGIAWTSIQAHYHYDHVAELPPSATLLASSDACRVQAYSVGLRGYGFQYHPEIDFETMDELAQDDPSALTRSGTSREELSQATKTHFPAFERLTDRLFENIGLLLMPVERRYRGLVKDLHH